MQVMQNIYSHPRNIYIFWYNCFIRMPIVHITIFSNLYLNTKDSTETVLTSLKEYALEIYIKRVSLIFNIHPGYFRGPLTANLHNKFV